MLAVGQNIRVFKVAVRVQSVASVDSLMTPDLMLSSLTWGCRVFAEAVLSPSRMCVWKLPAALARRHPDLADEGTMPHACGVECQVSQMEVLSGCGCARGMMSLSGAQAWPQFLAATYQPTNHS